MSIVSGTLQAIASEDAASTQAATARDATAMQWDMYQQGRKDTAPWREAGEEALNTLVSKVKDGPGDFYKSPDYNFRLQEGIDALESGAAARGNLLGGATQKALEKYGQDYATTNYQNWLANYYNSLTPFQSLAGVGQTTASQNAVAGQQTAQNAASTMMTGANAQAAGSINMANAFTGASNSGVNNYMLWKYMNGAGAGASGANTAGGMYTVGQGGNLVESSNILDAAYMV